MCPAFAPKITADKDYFFYVEMHVVFQVKHPRSLLLIFILFGSPTAQL